jgi:tryptophan synthase alpha chain
MSVDRLDRAFARARAEKRAALVLYLTAGDPDLETSRRLVLAAAEEGADIIEVGVPWSDPSADGAAIQAAMARALTAGGGPKATFSLVEAVRRENPDVGLVFFGYANPIFIMGAEAFAKRVAEVGGDGVLCVDWPPDEAVAFRKALAEQRLGFVPLVAPTSLEPRIRLAGEAATGFIYYVSLTGITGARLVDKQEPSRRVEAIRAWTGGKTPIVVGFGVKSPEDAHEVAAFADGVVVGSAAVELVQKAQAAGEDPVAALRTFVRSLRAAVVR